jgi:hypothetical protein
MEAHQRVRISRGLALNLKPIRLNLKNLMKKVQNDNMQESNNKLVADTPLLEKDSKTLSRLFPKVNS